MAGQECSPELNNGWRKESRRDWVRYDCNQVQDGTQAHREGRKPSSQNGRMFNATSFNNIHGQALLLGHDGNQAVDELCLVLRLDLDDVGVPAVQQVPAVRVGHRLLERLEIFICVIVTSHYSIIHLSHEVLPVLILHGWNTNHHREAVGRVERGDQHQRQGGWFPWKYQSSQQDTGLIITLKGNRKHRLQGESAQSRWLCWADKGTDGGVGVRLCGFLIQGWLRPVRLWCRLARQHTRKALH